jgi:hypothetical protein
MKYIVTEQQLTKGEEYQKKWKRFENFIKRRNDIIEELISYYIVNYYKNEIGVRSNDSLITSIKNKVAKDIITNAHTIDDDDWEYDWVHFYIDDNYTEYIRKELGL